MVCAGLALAGATTAFGLSRLDPRPERSLALWPHRAEPHLHLGQAALAGNDLATAVLQGRQALERDPLSARAFSLLGQTALRQGDVPGTDALMSAASRRSLRDAPSQAWIFARGLERGDFAGGLSAYDVLMRRRPDLGGALSPLVFAAADRQPKARAALAQRLALAPSWRPAFLAGYSRATTEPAAVHAVLVSLRTTAHPPTGPEMRVYLDRLLRDRSYVAAYVAWAQHQPKAAGLAGVGVQDGGFESDPGLAPFGWQLSTADGASAERAALPSGVGFGLRAAVSGGLARRTIAEQMIVLPTGDHELRGRAWLENGDADGRLIWTVQCEGAPRRVLATVEPVVRSRERWTAFKSTVVVPADCPAQRLRLETRPGSSLAPVSIVFDDLEIRRQVRRAGPLANHAAVSIAGAQ